jgi:hypothetical protein
MNVSSVHEATQRKLKTRFKICIKISSKEIILKFVRKHTTRSQFVKKKNIQNFKMLETSNPPVKTPITHKKK